MNYSNIESINKKYQVIYADCPWTYDNKRTGGNYTSGASQKYNTMSVDELTALPIQNITHDNCVLFMWATVPLLPEAFHVLDAWRFQYKTKMTWDKQLIGMGHWFRGITEELLVAVQGNVKPFHSQLPNLIRIPRLKHSKKPHKFREIIEGVTYGLEPRIELFARTKIHGWDTWGNDSALEQPTLDEINLDNFTGAVN